MPSVVAWTPWRTFPSPHSGTLDAPAGPGVFEVRHVTSGAQIAFSVSANVAESLAILTRSPASGLFAIFARRGCGYRPQDLEYRVCATASMKEARAEQDRLNGRRRAYLRRRAC